MQGEIAVDGELAPGGLGDPGIDPGLGPVPVEGEDENDRGGDHEEEAGKQPKEDSGQARHRFGFPGWGDQQAPMPARGGFPGACLRDACG
jgi:hypothetical protein